MSCFWHQRIKAPSQARDFTILYLTYLLNASALLIAAFCATRHGNRCNALATLLNWRSAKVRGTFKMLGPKVTCKH